MAQLIRTVVARYQSTIESLTGIRDAIEARLKMPFRRFGDVGLEFNRGFPSKAYMPLETFLEHGNEILLGRPNPEVVLNLPNLAEHRPGPLRTFASARARRLPRARARTRTDFRFGMV